MRVASVAFLVCVLFGCCHSIRILGIFPYVSSHYFLGNKLMRGMAKAGHDVTVIAPYEEKEVFKNGSYTTVLVPEIHDVFQQILKDVNMFEMGEKPFIFSVQLMAQMFSRPLNVTLTHPNVKKLINSGQKFDVVIMEQFMNDPYKYFADIFQCPLVLLSAMGPGMMVNSLVGNPTMVAYDPGFTTIKGKEMTFYERLTNLLSYVSYNLAINYYVLPKHNDLLKSIFPDADLYKNYHNVSLVLANSHPALSRPVPLVPNMVEIGGYHIDPPKALPADLQQLLDGSKEGVIYFSMGSNLKSKDLPEKTKAVFMNVFSRLREKVLWKFEDESLPGKPKNVVIKKWLPQTDILAHPNVKLFITHGGMLSSTETVYHGVPTLAIPVFGDQFANSDRSVQRGIGLKLPYSDIATGEQQLESLIRELLDNPKYKQNSKRMSELFHDRPMTPMQSAAYWVEYVVRHKGAPHLRVAGTEMPLYKYLLIDVIIFLCTVVLSVIYLFYFMFKRICRKRQVEKVKKN